MSLRQYAKNAGLLAAQSVVQRGLGFVTSVVLARGLGPADFGVYNVFRSTPDNAYGLLKLGVDAAIHVNTAEGGGGAQGAHKGGVLAAGFVLLGAAGVAATGLCVALAPWLSAVVFGQPGLTPWIRAAAVLVAAQFVLQYAHAGLAGLHRFDRYARVMMATGVANLAAVAVGVAVAGLPGAVVATLAMAIGNAGWLAWELRRSLRQARLTLRLDLWREGAREVLRLGLPFYFANLSVLPVTYYLQGLVSREAGLEALGSLRVVTTLTALITFLPASIAAASISSLTAVRTSGAPPRMFAEQASLQLKLVWLFSLLMALGTCAVLPWLVGVLFGRGYTGVLGAARIGLFAAVLQAAEGVGGQVLFSQRRTGLVFGLMASRSAVTLVVGLAVVPAHGAAGYLGAELVGLAVSVGLIVVLLGREIPLGGLAWRLTALAVAYGVAAGGVVGAAWQGGALASAGAAAVGGLLLPPLAYVLVLSGNERQRLASGLAALRSRAVSVRVGGG